MAEMDSPKTARKKELNSADQRENIIKTLCIKISDTQTNILAGKVKSAGKNEYLLELIDLTNKVSDLGDYISLKELFKVLRLLCVDKEKLIRSQAFRTLRKVISDSRMIKAMLECNIDVLISRALEREQRYLWERMQALKLCRQIIDVCPDLIPRSVVMSLVSVAEFQDDDFRKVCLDTLRELSLTNIEIVASCNGIATLVESIMDPKCDDLANSMTLTLIYLLDQEHTRRYIRSSSELQRLLYIFTDTDAPDSPEKESRKRLASEALIMMMRSWTGILILSSDKNGIPSVIKSMSLPDKVRGAQWSRAAISDLLFELIEVVKLPCYNEHGSRSAIKPNLLHNYIVMVLLSLVNCGVIEVLTDIGISGSGEASALATSLLSTILNLCADLLPTALNAKLNALPSVVNLSSRFDGEIVERNRACKMLGVLAESSRQLSSVKETASHTTSKMSSIQKSENSKSKSQVTSQREQFSKRGAGPLTLEVLTSVTDSNSNYRRYRRYTKERMRQQALKSLRIQADARMDENDVNVLLKDSGVIAGKEYQKWDFEICLELLEGPLLNFHHLNYVLQKTKFLKRLISFLKPSKKLFSQIPWTVDNFKYSAVACQVFRVMTSSEDISKDENFLKLIDELLVSLLNVVSQKPMNPEFLFDSSFLSSNSLVSTLSFEYITLIGILSETKHGLKFLEKYGVFEELYKLCHDESLQYLTRLIVSNLDFGQHVVEVSKARQLLTFFLNKGDSNLKMFCIEHMRLMLRTHVEGFHDWGLEMLVTALQKDKQTALSALSVLEEVSDHKELLSKIIKLNPVFDQVRESANFLMLKFLADPDGIEYLRGLNWIDTQFSMWKNEGIVKYVEELENALVLALNDNTTTPRFGGMNCRTMDEEYFYDRLYGIPWRFEFLILSSDGSEYPLSSDAYVQCYPQEDGGMQIYVTAEIRKDKSNARFNKIDSSCVISASLFVGKEENLFSLYKDKFNRRCSGKARQSLTSSNPVVTEDGAIWRFAYVPKNEDDDEDDDVNDRNLKDKLILKSVSFNLPAASNGLTTVSFAPHFYGELAKTPQGIDILKQSAHIEHFVETIKNPRATWIDRRAALWSIGQIGSSPLGFELLCKSDIIEFISHEAFNCTTLSMRGTCFYIVGLLSATSQARNMLSRLGWDFPLNKELCIAVPKDVKKFLSVPDDESILSWPLDPKNLYGVSKVPANTNKPVVKITSESFGPTILGNISNLGNNVTQKSSHSALLKMRQRYPHYFQSTALFFETSKLFSCYSLRLPARRFVWFDLFDQVDFSVKGLAALDENNTETNENVKYIESE